MDALTKWSETAVATAKPPLSLKRLALIGLGCALTLAASGYGTYWWAVDRFFQSTDDSYVGGDVTPISPHIAGFVAEILVNDNERVHAGQLLVRLDDRDVRAAADHAQAVLEQRSATLVSLRAKYELQQSAIQQASADLDAKIAQAGFAKVDADRYRTLALSNYGSRQDAERTSALDARAGAYVSQGAYLLTMVPSEGLWVDANFKEDQLARMKAGQAATIVADTLPGHVFHGRLLSLAPATGAVFSIIPPENATGNFTKIVQRVAVRVALDENDSNLGMIRPGLSTIATVDTRSRSGGVK